MCWCHACCVHLRFSRPSPTSKRPGCVTGDLGHGAREEAQVHGHAAGPGHLQRPRAAQHSGAGGRGKAARRRAARRGREARGEAPPLHGHLHEAARHQQLRPLPLSQERSLRKKDGHQTLMNIRNLKSKMCMYGNLFFLGIIISH